MTEMDNQPRMLQAGEVVSLQKPNDYLIHHSTFKVDEFISAMQRNCGRPQPQWFAEGIECEVLTPGTGWQKGRVRICLEFCSEEPIADKPVSYDLATENEINKDSYSPLDEIRLSIQENI